MININMVKMNEELTNALIIQCIGTQYSPTCFGTLKCHHQGITHDPAEIGAQCREKQMCPFCMLFICIYSF
jgi:hypothetical protein